MSEAFAHLHVASGFSLRYGASTPATLVERAAALGQPALALTDRDGLYGAIRFVQACDEAGIAPVLGVDLAVDSRSGSRDIGLVSVIVTAMVVALAAGGLLRVLERRTARAGRVWTGLALAVLVASLAGPAGAATPSAGLALAAMHLVVGAVVIVGLRRRIAGRGDRVA